MIAGKTKRALRSLVYRLLQSEWIRKALILFPFFRRVHGGAHLTHPIDRQYGIDTSSFYPGDLIAPGPEVNAYLGSSPDLLRRALSLVPELAQANFVDFGCGKGRALVVASEFPFRRITGFELSPVFSAIALRNAAILARSHPDRSRIEVECGDALGFPLPEGNLVAFCYNSFRRESTGALMRLLERHAATGAGVIFIYFNPEWAEVVGASPGFTLWTSLSLDDEAGHGLGRPDFRAQLWRSVSP